MQDAQMYYPSETMYHYYCYVLLCIIIIIHLKRCIIGWDFNYIFQISGSDEMYFYIYGQQVIDNKSYREETSLNKVLGDTWDFACGFSWDTTWDW